MPFTQRVKTYMHLHRQPFKLHFIIGIKRRGEKINIKQKNKNRRDTIVVTPDMAVFVSDIKHS